MARRRNGKNQFDGDGEKLDRTSEITEGYKQALGTLVADWLMVSGLCPGCKHEDGSPIEVDRVRTASVQTEIRAMLDRHPGIGFVMAGFAVWTEAGWPPGSFQFLEVVEL